MAWLPSATSYLAWESRPAEPTAPMTVCAAWPFGVIVIWFVTYAKSSATSVLGSSSSAFTDQAGLVFCRTVDG